MKSLRLMNGDPEAFSTSPLNKQPKPLKLGHPKRKFIFQPLILKRKFNEIHLSTIDSQWQAVSFRERTDISHPLLCLFFVCLFWTILRCPLTHTSFQGRRPWFQINNPNHALNYGIPGIQMTRVLNVKGLYLEGSNLKIRGQTRSRLIYTPPKFKSELTTEKWPGPKKK